MPVFIIVGLMILCIVLVNICMWLGEWKPIVKSIISAISVCGVVFLSYWFYILLKIWILFN